MENDSTAQPHLGMSQWVIYEHPRDYPGQFVLRRWDMRRISGEEPAMVPTDEMALAQTLEEIRKRVPAGLFRLRRFEDDDPCIVEVWV